MSAARQAADLDPLNAEPRGDASRLGAMDRVVERRRLSARVRRALLVGLIASVALAFWLWSPGQMSKRVDAKTLTISVVRRGTFDDFLPLRARVTPLKTVFLDSVEGGRVEKILVEDGMTVREGQPLAILSNPELQLSVLARQTEVTQQINSLRSQELVLEQTRLVNERDLFEARAQLDKLNRQYRREAALLDKGFVSRQRFEDTAADLESARGRYAVQVETRRTNERLQTSQLAQIRAAVGSLNAGLEIARRSLEALQLRAPVSGKLSGLSVQLGQSLARGERIGQIDSPGENKLMAGVDEFYLNRVRVGQAAMIETGGRSYSLRVSKIYPQVRNGQFEIDLQFVAGEPPRLQRGQTLQARLTLSEPVPALMVSNGPFHNDTGGGWAFVVTPDGATAVRRPVRFGRRNSEQIEVLDGLAAGERVITSGYTGMTDSQALVLGRD